MKNQKSKKMEMLKEQIPIKKIKTTLIEVYKIQDADIEKTFWGWEIGEMDMDEMETALMNLEIVKNMIVEKYFEFMQEE